VNAEKNCFSNNGQDTEEQLQFSGPYKMVISSPILLNDEKYV
jgi:hypothetical protein